MKKSIKSVARLGTLTLLAGAIVACGGDDDNDNTVNTPAPLMYEITVTNGTAAQPFSPVAVVAHGSAYSAFEIGEPATVGLEMLAEGGSNTQFISEADGAPSVYGTASGDAPVGPGASDVVTIEVAPEFLPTLQVSVVTMLVNTNDAISALRGKDISGFEVGDEKTVRLISYDTGTEANTEAAGTIPGPADQGEGFNAVRDDLTDAVSASGGVVTADDGLATSVLDHTHKWDHPVMTVSVKRVQ